MARAPTKSGRMRCPRHAEVDVEQCFSCFAFRDLRARRGQVELRCIASGQPFKVDEVMFALMKQPRRGA